MRKTLRTTALVGAIGLASWLSTNTQAQAGLSCSHANGGSCSPAGSVVPCVEDSGVLGYCTCGINLLWSCV